MNNKIEMRKCKFSGVEFYPKRNNQVFASTKNRISFHNSINNILRNKLKVTSNQLIYNYKICCEILGKNKTVTVHREFLKGKGFDFVYFTSLTEAKNPSGTAYAVFDTSFEKIDENNYLISKL